MLCSLATKLDQGQIEEIESLAQDLGTPILAFACHQTDAAPIDDARSAGSRNSRASSASPSSPSSSKG